MRNNNNNYYYHSSNSFGGGGHSRTPSILSPRLEPSASFVGLGVGADQPAWGQMIADARQYVYQSPWNLLFPILAIFLTVAAFNLLGDGLRRTLDVRLADIGR